MGVGGSPAGMADADPAIWRGPLGEACVRHVPPYQRQHCAPAHSSDAHSSDAHSSDAHSTLTLLALAVYLEARGEGAIGQAAVVHVVRNRVLDPRWPNSIRGVLLQPWQFSCFNDWDGTVPDAFVTQKATWVSRVIAAWRMRDVTDGATHYHADYVAPRWAQAMVHTVTYGRHIFYRDDTNED